MISQGQPKKKNISAQHVSPELWTLTNTFLRDHPNMRGRGDLVRIAVESYIALALEYGIDGGWRPMVPGVQKDVYAHAYDRIERLQRAGELSRTRQVLEQDPEKDEE